MVATQIEKKIRIKLTMKEIFLNEFVKHRNQVFKISKKLGINHYSSEMVENLQQPTKKKSKKKMKSIAKITKIT